MFKKVFGALCGAFLLFGAFAKSAQARELELLEVYELAASMISRQNPLFLFPGLQADRMTVNGNGGEYHIVISGLGLPGSAATVPEPVVIRLPRTASDGDLIDVTIEGLPTSTIMPNGQSLKLIDPVFKGAWSVSRRGFERFELTVERVRFQGRGIAYTVRNIRATLDQVDGRHVMKFSADSYIANYGDSFTGEERARAMSLELSVPTENLSSQVLVAIAYRLSALALSETEIQEVFAPNPPTAKSLDGLQVKINFEGEQWEQTVPPSKGSIEDFKMEVGFEPSSAPGHSRIRVTATLGSIAQTLEAMTFRMQRPGRLFLLIDGIESESLADLFLDRAEGFDEPELGENLSFQGVADVGSVAVVIPDADLDFGARGLTGSISSLPGEDGMQSLELSARMEKVELVDWLNREQLEPFASKIIAPLLPNETEINIAVEGLESKTVRDMAGAALGFDFGGIGKALPKDLGALSIVLKDSFYKSRLVQADWSGRLQPRRGRIPVKGTFELVTSNLAPIQIGMQQSIATPVPAVSQSMSAGILGLTLFQTMAKREEGGKLRFVMEFPESGGLPLVNGRPLPFQQFIR